MPAQVLELHQPGLGKVTVLITDMVMSSSILGFGPLPDVLGCVACLFAYTACERACFWRLLEALCMHILHNIPVIPALHALKHVRANTTEQR